MSMVTNIIDNNEGRRKGHGVMVNERESNPFDFGAWLASERLQKNLTQEEFGEQVGVAQGTVSVWESNLRRPGMRRVRAIAAVLGHSVEAVQERIDEAGPPVSAEDQPHVRFASDERPAAFLDPIIAPFMPLNARQRREIAGVVRGYLESHRSPPPS